MRATPTRTGALGLAGALAAALLLALPAWSDSAPAPERSWQDPDRIATSVDIDDDSIVIRTESRNGADPEKIEIVPQDEGRVVLRNNKVCVKRSRCGVDTHVRWDLSCLKGLGCIDVDSCDEDAMVRFGEDIRVRRGERLDRDVLAVGGSVRIDGDVEGDVVALGGRIIVGSRARIDGDVVAVAGKLVLHDGCEIEGDAVSVGGHLRDDGARVAGNTTRVDFNLW